MEARLPKAFQRLPSQRILALVPTLVIAQTQKIVEVP